MFVDQIDFMSQGVQFNLTLTLSGTGPTGTVTAISGSVGSATITGLDPNNYQGADNLIVSTTGAFADYNGISFDANNVQYNIYGPVYDVVISNNGMFNDASVYNVSFNNSPTTITLTSPAVTSASAAQTITGTVINSGVAAAVGPTVTIDDNGTSIGTATVALNGTFSANVTLPQLGNNIITATVTDTYNNTVTSAAVTDIYAVTPTITGTSTTPLATSSEAAVAPFAQVTIADANPGATDTLSITLADNAGLGTLTGTGLTGTAATGYTLSGTAAAITSELDALVFTPAAGTPNTSHTTSFTLSDTSSAFSTPATDSNTSVIDTDPATGPVNCYSRGTRIETPVGDVEIEALAVGDLVLTASGAARPIRWIGTRQFEPRFVGRNPKILPIRICRDALADGVPRRDLLVSPEHAMLIDGVLVAAKYLVNGVSIRQEEPGVVIEYFHIELDEHDAVLAEGAAAETYVEDGDRGMFHNAQAYRTQNRGAVPPARYCAARIEHGARLDAIRARFDERAGVRAIITDEPDIHLLADGAIILPDSDREGALGFHLPSAANDIVLVSRRTTGTGVDRRGLGIAVAGIMIDGESIGLGALPDRGWHKLERQGSRCWRWTDGTAQLPAIAQSCRLTIEIAGTASYRRFTLAA